MTIHWSALELESLPVRGEPLYKGDDRLIPYQGDVVMTGHPDVIVRARDVQEVADVLAYCHAHHMPVTFMGGQTGLTGASAADNGVVIVTEQLQRVLDIGQPKSGFPYAIAEPGILLGDLKASVLKEGFFYPPDPTSYKEARLGGTVATNATGEDTLLYGPTRSYVRALKVIRADGHIIELRRPIDDRPPTGKGTAGYIREQPPIDLLIGSEGTLGYLAEITVDLVPEPADWWSAIGFFPSLETALDFVVRTSRSDKVVPRAMELMDERSLEIFKDAKDVPTLPKLARAALYWKQEYRSKAEQEKSLANWYKLFRSEDSIWVARDAGQKEQFREWRHSIPSIINERVELFREAGGGKVASDWWVPMAHIKEALQEARAESEQAGLAPIIFGHIGNGHPHINYFAHNREERAIGLELIRRQCQRAVRWGGGVAGEHGLGKLHRDLLSVQHGPAVIDKMLAIKREWDPHWILGRGTLFDVPAEFR